MTYFPISARCPDWRKVFWLRKVPVSQAWTVEAEWAGQRASCPTWGQNRCWWVDFNVGLCLFCRLLFHELTWQYNDQCTQGRQSHCPRDIWCKTDCYKNQSNLTTWEHIEVIRHPMICDKAIYLFGVKKE